MPKSVINKWREVNRSFNQMIKSSSSQSEHDIMNTEHMHENENDVNDVNDSFTNIENTSYNYISSTEIASNSNEGHFEITNESSLRRELAIWATNNNCTRTCVTQLLTILLKHGHGDEFSGDKIELVVNTDGVPIFKSTNVKL